MTRLQPHDFGAPVAHWRVSFWWKPDVLTRQRFLTLKRDRGKGYNEMFTIDFVHESDTEPVGEDNFAIEIWLYDFMVDCYVPNPITVNEWNKISIEFNVGEIVTSANGVVHRVNMMSDEMGDFAVEFQDWYIGERTNNDGIQGLSGVIDVFEVANLEIAEDPVDSTVDSGSAPTWIWAVLIVCGVVGVCFWMFIFYFCCCSKEKPSTPKSEFQRKLGLEETMEPAHTDLK